MTKNILLLFLISTLSFQLSAHMEVVAQFNVNTIENELFVTARVEKQNLVNALSEEGDCSLTDMMKVCGDIYIRENFEISIDGIQLNLTLIGFRIEKNEVVFDYNALKDISEALKIEIACRYVFKYNSHAISRTYVDLFGQQKEYDFTLERGSVVLYNAKTND